MKPVLRTKESIPKSEWGPGPWMKEPDYYEFVTEAGLHAVCLRNFQGSWCAYVAVTKKHPAFGAHYDCLDISVHGGLTYGKDFPPTGSRRLRRKGQRYWFGFDCAHHNDIWPSHDALMKTIGMSKRRRESDCRYRTLTYVKKECELLAEQLVAMASPRSSKAKR